MKKLLLLFILSLFLTSCGNNVVPVNPEPNKDDSGESKSDVIIVNDSGDKEPDDITDDSGENDMSIIDEKIAQMSLKDKIEQMMILDYSLIAYGKEDVIDVSKLSSDVNDSISKHNFGGIILFRDNIKGTKQTYELVNSFQEAALNSKLKIPFLISIDQEGGNIIRLATGTSMPGNIALGAINDYDITKEYASIIGNELNALGINVDFAPVLDVNSNPSNPIIGLRSFSSDTSRVSNMGEAFIEGLHSEGVASTLKHFPGHGDTATDSHTGLPMINKTYEDIKNFELIPFKAGIDKGADMIMTAHIVYPQIEKETYISKKTGKEINLPATLSKTILTDILRKDLGFEGIIVTDALNMAAVADHFDKKDVARLAINAGADILLMPISLSNKEEKIDEYVNMVVDLVNNGEISEERIDSSVYRILRLKEKLGLLKDNPFELDEDKALEKLKVVGSKEHHDKELEIAKKAITLVKGDDLLPIDKEEKVLFLTSYNNVKNNIEYAIDLLKNQKVIDDTFKYEIADFENKDYSSLKSKVDNASIIIMTVETTKSANFDNNSKDGWQGRFIDKAIADIHKQNKKAIVISCMLPYDVSRYDDADVVLCAYGNRIISDLPIVYDGETKTFGLNISSAIIKLFDDGEFNATLPVDIYTIDSNYKYTNDIYYKVK